jgi:transposase
MFEEFFNSRCDALNLLVPPVDMRLGIDGLSIKVQELSGNSLYFGEAYIFSNRSRTRIKLIFWDDNGAVLLNRRLHHGSFIWPKTKEQIYKIEQQLWPYFWAGMDWQRLLKTSKTECIL